MPGELTNKASDIMAIKNPELSEALENVTSLRKSILAGWSSQIFKGSWKLLALPLLLFIVVPLLSLFLRTTFSVFFATLNQKQVIEALSLSLFTSLSAMLVTLIMGTPVAYLLAQPRFRFHRIVDTIIDLPTVLPPSVAGLALLMAFGRRGLFGPFLATMGMSIPFTVGAVIMAQTFVAAPYYVKAAAIGFAGIDHELKQAAALDGANRWQIFRYVTLPLSWMALVSGSVMTWARALGEFGATILFAGNFQGKTQTMPLAIYVGFETDLNVAVTLSIILVFFSFLILMVVKHFLHRQLEVDIEIASL